MAEGRSAGLDTLGPSAGPGTGNEGYRNRPPKVSLALKMQAALWLLAPPLLLKQLPVLLLLRLLRPVASCYGNSQPTNWTQLAHGSSGRPVRKEGKIVPVRRLSACSYLCCCFSWCWWRRRRWWWGLTSCDAAVCGSEWLRRACSNAAENSEGSIVGPRGIVRRDERLSATKGPPDEMWKKRQQQQD